MRLPSLPAGFHNVNPHLMVRDAERAIQFYTQAFDATERFRLVEPGGRIAHAELRIGDSVLMVSEESPESGSSGRRQLDPPSAFHLYVGDADATFERAIELGAEVLIPLADQFYGDRAGRVRDPFGHHWVIATHVEEMDPVEMQRRFEEFLRQQTAR